MNYDGAPAKAWLIVYDTGETFSSKQGTPEQAPAHGIICIVEILDDERSTRKALNGGDYYIWTGENWVTMMDKGLDRWLEGHVKQVKFGRWTVGSKFRQAIKEATNLEVHCDVAE